LIVQRFKTDFAERIFRHKYAQGPNDSWDALAERLVADVCGPRRPGEAWFMSDGDRKDLVEDIKQMRFIPGGRYLYYAGRPYKAYNNCYLLRAEEDTREEWSAVTWRAMSCLMTGGGIGIDYSRLRPAGKPLSRTGGIASGPIPLMYAINEIGRNVMQGGSRRSAIYASLNWQHEDITEFLRAKNWSATIKQLKEQDFNFPAPLDMTNISVNYDNTTGDLNQNKSSSKTVGRLWKLENLVSPLILDLNRMKLFAMPVLKSLPKMILTCATSVALTLEILLLEDFAGVVNRASKFLVCGTLRADLPYEKVYRVREKNRRLGLRLMGVSEWLMQRGYDYEVNNELKKWLDVYANESERSANEHCDRFYISRPVAYRAIAPTGTIGILASTTTGIEPLFAVAYKRRYLTDGTKWKYQYVVDATADRLIKEYGVDPEKIRTAYSLSSDYERRIKFQADTQDYVDMSISSTINLPSWGSKNNNESKVSEFAETLAKYAPRLRGFTAYPDGSRGGQPITEVPYSEAVGKTGVEYSEVDICEWTGHGGSCGV